MWFSPEPLHVPYRGRADDHPTAVGAEHLKVRRESFIDPHRQEAEACAIEHVRELVGEDLEPEPRVATDHDDPVLLEVPRPEHEPGYLGLPSRRKRGAAAGRDDDHHGR